MDKGERYQALSAAAAVAVPIVLAIFGYLIQRQIADQGVAKDYVQIAATILKEDPKGQEPELRAWAVSVLSKYSPLPFSAKAKEGLRAGPPVVGPPIWPAPVGCLVPGKPSKIQAWLLHKPKGEALNDSEIDELLRMLPDDLAEMTLTRSRLQCMQSVFALAQREDDSYRSAIGALSSASEVEAYEKAHPASAPTVAPAVASRARKAKSSSD
jgi:hypothetical protein